MKTSGTKLKKKQKINRIMIVMFLLLFILIGLLFYWYYLRLQDTIRAESQGYIQEISKQAGNTVEKNVNDKYAVLENLASVLKNSQVDTYDQLKQVVDEQHEIWNFQKILVFDQNGTAYDSNGKVVALTNDPYLQDVIVRKEWALSTDQVIDGKNSIIFAFPLENITIGSIPMVALAASYDLSTFDQILEIGAFDGRGYAHIIRKDGTAVVRSSSPNALQTGYNILNSLSEATYSDDKTIEQIKADILLEISGNAEFSMGDSHEYMTYLPLFSQNWSLLTFVPVDVVNAKSNMMLSITLLLCGVITLTFAVLLTSMMRIHYHNKRRLEQIAYVDSVTGGNTIERFYELARDLLDSSGKLQYALVYTNIEKFKVLNEQSGRKACDDILCSIEHGIRTALAPNECVGRLSADNFCVMINYTDEASLVDRFDEWYRNATDYVESKGNVWLPLTIAFGVYVIDNTSMPFPYMIDRAKLSLSESAREFRGKMRYAIYNEQVRRQLFRDKQLEDRMEVALENREFQVYLQPKYRTKTKTVDGAEVLVRWDSPDEGMIFPNEFIPLFEKNGFVIQLDFYMFESICKIIRNWLDHGIKPIKVSVNCSRLHLKNMDFLKNYCKMADNYQVPRALLEIELTENTVFGDVERLSEIIRSIRDAGFGCSMDDFGSGYSSLNLIQDIPVDTLKLDKVFFRTTKDMQRSESVVGSIITMSKALNMETVAEGVEERIQVDMLERLDCDLIQGYYFAKPMPVDQFEKLAFGKIITEIEGDVS